MRREDTEHTPSFNRITVSLTL